MATEQPKSEQHVEMLWETPTHDEIVDLTKAHVGGMEATDADVVWQQAGMHHILIENVGRKSGTVHKVALPTWNDDAGNRIVVASFAGHERNPSWFVNVRDREANPRVRCRVQTGAFWSEHEILEGEERNRIWELLTADRAWYRDYQAKTERLIPLVRLPETEEIALEDW